MNKIIRYIVMKNDEVPASYSTELGQDTAYSFAKQNARRYDGKIFSQNTANEYVEVDFRRKK